MLSIWLSIACFRPSVKTVPRLAGSTRPRESTFLDLVVMIGETSHSQDLDLDMVWPRCSLINGGTLHLSVLPRCSVHILCAILVTKLIVLIAQALALLLESLEVTVFLS